MPDMGIIQVGFDSLGTAQADIGQTSNKVNQQLADLKSFIAPMVAEWSGDAATHYQAKQREWDTAAADLNLILSNISKAVGLANADFQDGERNNAAIWS